MGLDDVGSGLSEIDELAQEMGMPAGGPLSQAANALEQAFGNPLGNPPIPLPPESFRFLIGPPTPGTTPTDGEDPEDHIAKAGRLLDQLGLVGGYGKMAAGVLNDEVLSRALGHDKKFDRPGWLVLDFNCSEGLSRLWQAEVTLVRPETVFQDVQILTAMDNFIQAWQPDKINSAPPGPFGMIGAIIQDLGEAAGGTLALWNQVRNPGQYAPFSDWENPDALDPKKVPDRATGTPAADTGYIVGKLAVDPADWLDQFARVSVARRGPDRFTFGERWWSGLCTEIEDLGDFGPNTRCVKILIQPRLWKLSLRKQNRIFQDMTAIQIIKQLLTEHGIYDGRDGTGTGVAGQLKLVPPPLSLGPLALPGEVAGAADGLGEMLGGLPFVGDKLSSVAEGASDLLRESEDKWTQKREICVQYDETDLELFERLLAEEGITFFFKSTERDEVLILADDPIYGGKKSLMTDRQPLQAVPGTALPVNAFTREIAWDVTSERQLVPSTVTVRDYNHSRPNYVTEVQAGALLPSLAGGTSVASTLGQIASTASEMLLAGSPASALLPGGADALAEADYAGAEAAWFEYPGPLNLLRKEKAPYLDPAAEYDTYDGEPIAQIALDRYRAEGARITGTSTALSLVPGNHVSLQNGGFDVLAKNPRQPVKLLVTDLFHTASNAVPATINPRDPTSRQYVNAGLMPSDLQYSNRFRMQNVMLRHRPQRPSRRPVIRGVQTATVLDVNWIDDPTVADDEAHVDKLWRALIRFHWDRRPFSFVAGDPRPDPTDPSILAHACWVRVASGFAGSGFGTIFAPRVGMEVLVAFRDGNPDRPVIVGCMNNGVAGDHTFAPGRDRSGKEANPQPRYVSDAARKTEAIIRTRSLPREDKERGNELMLVDNGGIEKIWLFAQRDLHERVRHDHLTTVRNDQSNRVGHDHVEKVGKDQTLFVNRKPTDDEDYCRTKTVTGNETAVKLGSGALTKEGRGHEIKGNDSITVDGHRSETIGASEFVTVDGKTAEGGRAEIARLLSVSGSEEVLVTQMDQLFVSGNREITAKGALTVKAAQITMSTPGAMTPGTGDPEADPENGITMSAEGVDGHGKGRVQIYGGNDVTVSSDADKVLVRAETSIVIRVCNHSIELDASDGAIRILADPDSELRVGTPGAFVSLTNAEAKIEVGESKILTTADTEAKGTFKGAKVELDFEGEIHMNAPSVEYQRST